PLWITGEWHSGGVHMLSATRTAAPSWFDQRRYEPTDGRASPATRSATERHLFTTDVLLRLGPAPTLDRAGTALASVSKGTYARARAALAPRYGDRLAIVENPWTAKDLAAADETIAETGPIATSGGLDAQGRMCRRGLFEVATAE